MVAKTLILACAGALALSGAAAGGSTVTTLRGTVGPGFTITLTKAGTPVTRLAPGMYRIVVSDRSPIHNFVIEKSGGAFERTVTAVGFQGTKTITVRLTRGQWEVYCQVHESTMKRHIGVGVAPKAED